MSGVSPFVQCVLRLGQRGMDEKTSRMGELILDWRRRGSPEQEAFPWGRSKQAWGELASDFRIELADFPDMLDRRFLWSLNEAAVPAEQVFLAVMIWGYGDIGYGPYRVRQMLESPRFIQNVSLARELCSEGKVLDAYVCLQQSKIRQLGPAFGTKVLVFFHKRDEGPAILDSVVAKWWNKHLQDFQSENGINAEVWNVRTYSRYMTWVTKMSTLFGLPASSIEQLMFEDGYLPPQRTNSLEQP